MDFQYHGGSQDFDMIGTELDGRYRIEAELGSGGVGTVYRALQLERQVAVAVKVLRPELAASNELRQRFAREARALTALSHPNIVAVVDSGVAADTAYLVMEMLEGETLSARLKRGALPVGETLGIMRQLLTALAFVHEQKLVHRDVKPANIFLQAEPAGVRVRLLDFGLAKFLAPEAGGPSLTRAGQVFGTPSYMAPEQIAGQQADPRTDVYAAGIVLFEMLAGRVPFQGDASDVMRRHIMEDLPLEMLPKDVPPGIVDVIRTAAAKTRPGRFADAREMLNELDRVGAGSASATARVVASRPDAFAPTLSLEKPVAPSVESMRPTTEYKPVEERMTVPETVATQDPAGAEKPLFQRAMRFGATVAILVSLGAAATAALAIYVLVTPGREEERKVVENALGLPGASASAGWNPKTIRSPEAWPSASEQTSAPPGSASAGGSTLLTKPSAGAASEETAENVPAAPSASSDAPEDNPQETAPPLPEEPATTAKAMEAHPLGPPPQNPWASTPGELLKIMARAHRTRGFDKRDMRELHKYNGRHPTDPRGHILLARGYLSRRWVKDAANEYAIALKVSDSTRGDPHLLPDLIRIVEFGSDEAVRLVVDVFGAAASPAVERGLETQSRPEVRARLERLRDEIGK